jgi:hypothetical protein
VIENLAQQAERVGRTQLAGEEPRIDLERVATGAR